MDDQLDNDLKNRIREVFDNFEDSAADEGWLLLRKKFPGQEKQRPLVWLWWVSVAAALLLFLGIGLWVVSTKKHSSEVLAAKPVKSSRQQILTADSSRIQPAQTKIVAINTRPGNTKPVNANTADVKPAWPGSMIADKKSLKQTAGKPGFTVQQTANGAAAGQPAGVSAGYAKAGMPTAQQPVNNSVAANVSSAKKSDSSNIWQQQYAVTDPAAAPGNATGSSILNLNKPSITPPAGAKPAGPVHSMAELFANEDHHPQKTDQPAQDKKVRFGVYAATFFNYAKGSNNQVNAGAGFTSDIRISKNLKLSTGLALAQNRLNFNKSTPPTSKVAESTPALTASYQTEASFAKASGAPVFKSYDASLVGLDIPVNLKYEFAPGKNDTYVSAGLSSGTFINEAYTASYSYPALAKAAGVEQQTTDETTRNSFNGFYFGKTLNVSFGVGYPLGKSNKLIIEPFLKYPLDGLGSQQIKFGAGGLNLKLNFTTGKK